ncbi:hypothetical protein A6S26_21845 [Nostoc sp. ATCC 43529]|nr:hypothetical protein A6S26_21845 [Nostoc sp. ATCC 43529]
MQIFPRLLFAFVITENLPGFTLISFRQIVASKIGRDRILEIYETELKSQEPEYRKGILCGWRIEPRFAVSANV